MLLSLFLVAFVLVILLFSLSIFSLPCTSAFGCMDTTRNPLHLNHGKKLATLPTPSSAQARGDPLGGLDLTPAGYAEMTRKLMEVTKTPGRVVLVLEVRELTCSSHEKLVCHAPTPSNMFNGVIARADLPTYQ